MLLTKVTLSARSLALQRRLRLLDSFEHFLRFFFPFFLPGGFERFLGLFPFPVGQG